MSGSQTLSYPYVKGLLSQTTGYLLSLLNMQEPMSFHELEVLNHLD